MYMTLLHGRGLRRAGVLGHIMAWLRLVSGDNGMSSITLANSSSVITGLCRLVPPAAAARVVLEIPSGRSRCDAVGRLRRGRRRGATDGIDEAQRVLVLDRFAFGAVVGR